MRKYEERYLFNIATLPITIIVHILAKPPPPKKEIEIESNFNLDGHLQVGIIVE